MHILDVFDIHINLTPKRFRYKKKTEELSKKKRETISDSFQPEPMMHVFVGFLRLANFVSAATVIFGLVTGVLLTMESDDKKVPSLFIKDNLKYPSFLKVIKG